MARTRADLSTAARWRVDLLGGFRVEDGSRCLTRLHSRYVVALLARLALWPHRDHPREELVELLWPGVAIGVGRNRLRQALSSLKRVLEVPGAPGAPLLQADRVSVRIAEGSIDCDAREFERCVASGDRVAALALYRGELLPGFYDEWVLIERARLEAIRDALSVSPTSASALAGEGNAASAAMGANLVPPTGVWHSPRATTAARSGIAERGLPSYLTRLFGAEAKIAALCRAVREHRLVTVVGPGGGGKTRLAIEVARTMYSADLGGVASDDASFAPPFDAIVLVPLLDAHSHAQLLDALRSALRLDAAADVLDGVVARFGGRRALLLLDNFEQLVGHGEAWVARLAAALPQLHVLVTSRRSLRLDGERLFVLAPLALPDAGMPLVDAVGNPAVALFADRATAVRGDFRVSARNHSAIVELVRILEGSPLAIELAASRVRSFAPAELLARLRQPPPRAGATPALDLLARNPGAAIDVRHASLNRTIAWSWQLLTEPQRTLACAMTVFRGGCSAAMLQAVSTDTADVDVDSGDARLCLDELLAHSLVQTLSATPPDSTSGFEPSEPADCFDSDADAPLRFQLYEPVREFAAAQLSAAQAAQWRSRHRAWAIAWVEALPRTVPLAAVRSELQNLCAALHSAAADDVAHDAARLIAAFAKATEAVTWPVEVLLATGAVLPRCDDANLRSRAHAVLAMLFYFAGGLLDEATRHAEAALADAPPGSSTRGNALYPLAVLRWRVASPPGEVLPLMAEARSLAADDLHLQARIDTLHGFILLGSGDGAVEEGVDRVEAALHLHERSLLLRRALGNRHAIHAGDYNIAHVRRRQGRLDEALAGFRAVAAAAGSFGDVNLQSRALDAIGDCLAEMRRFDEAIDALRASVRLAWRHLHRQALLWNLWNLCRPLARSGEPERALTLAAFAEAFWRSTIGELPPGDEREHRRVRRLAAVQCPPQACADAWRRGEAMSLADAVALALGD